jgi:hypothetical protein
MVRANRPGRTLLGLSKLLVGAFGTAAFALTTNTIWQMGDALGGLRLAVIMLLGADRVGGLADRRARPVGETGPETRRSSWPGCSTWVRSSPSPWPLRCPTWCLFAGTVLAAALLIDTSVLEQTLQRPVGFTDYLTLAWIISSLATVGGAIGSGLEDEEPVRAAAYGYHPEPGGWRDEKHG